MKVEQSGIGNDVKRVRLIAPDSEEFHAGITSLWGREPDELLTPALPYSVLARNDSPRPIAFLGLRFDMIGTQLKPYSVVHYADTLRHPESPALPPGTLRFVCAEPLYTDLVLRRGLEIDRRGPMNLQNLRKILRIQASIDCVAFTDGEFAGKDSLRCFERLEAEREAELALLDELRQPGCDRQAILSQAMEIQPERDRALLARRVLARRLNQDPGCQHRLRIKLWRAPTAASR